jgi:hypothetical protein
MGSVSSSLDESKQAAAEADVDMVKMSTKLQLMLYELEKKRGKTESDVEITGGRSVMRYEKIFISQSTNLKTDISDAIDSFFTAADSGIDGDESAAKHSAVNGAKKLVDSAVKQCTENRSAETSEVKSFEIVFLNNAFCRIDYYLWQQYIVAAGVGWSMAAMTETTKAVRILVCDIAVIPSEMLKPEEITFLLSRALHIPNGSFQAVLKMAAGLAQVTMLSTIIKAITEKLQKQGITDPNELDRVTGAMVAIALANAEISAAFESIGDVDHPKNLHMAPKMSGPIVAGPSAGPSVALSTPPSDEASSSPSSSPGAVPSALAL